MIDDTEVAVSVIICTRNRAASLSRLLESFRKAAPSWSFEWELVIVDNGSSDGTADLLVRHVKEGWLPLKTFHEPMTGLSRARNMGIAKARGDVLAFTDDDCLVTPQWLTEIRRTFVEDPNIGVVGGGSELADTNLFQHCVRTSRVPMTYQWPTEPNFAAGNNLAIRASALQRVGEFDTRLGAGTAVHSAEDTDMIYRLLRSGSVARFVPDALVYHDHGRNEAELLPIRRNYMIGTGAFLTKHVLSGDSYAARMTYWHVRAILFGEKPIERQFSRGEVLRGLLSGALRRLLHLDH